MSKGGKKDKKYKTPPDPACAHTDHVNINLLKEPLRLAQLVALVQHGAKALRQVAVGAGGRIRPSEGTNAPGAKLGPGGSAPTYDRDVLSCASSLPAVSGMYGSSISARMCAVCRLTAMTEPARALSSLMTFHGWVAVGGGGGAGEG